MDAYVRTVNERKLTVDLTDMASYSIKLIKNKPSLKLFYDAFHGSPERYPCNNLHDRGERFRTYRLLAIVNSSIIRGRK